MLQGEKDERKGGSVHVYVGNRTQEERAFWEAVDSFRFPEGHEKEGKIHWAGFMRYITGLVYEDRRRKGLTQIAFMTVSMEGQVRDELDGLRRKVDRLEQLIGRGDFVPKSDEAKELADTVKRVREKSDRGLVSDW